MEKTLNALDVRLGSAWTRFGSHRQISRKSIPRVKSRSCLEATFDLVAHSGRAGHPGNSASVVLPMYFKSSMPILLV
jgi:hypothetical protein